MRRCLFIILIFAAHGTAIAQSLASLVSRDYQPLANDVVVSSKYSQSGAHFFVAGTIDNPPFSPGGTTGNTHSFLTKFDSTGAEEWTIIDVDQYNSSFLINAMTIDDNDNVYITGYYKGYLSFGGQTLPYISTSGYGYFAGKVSPSGTTAWLAGGSTSTGNAWSGISVDIDASGNVYTLARFANTVTIAGSTFTVAPLSSKNLVIKYDNSGNALWAQEYGFFSNSAGGGFTKLCVAKNASANIYLAGSMQGTLTLGGFTLTSSPSNLDLLLMKLDNGGTILDAGLVGGPGNEFLTDMQLKGNSILFTGEFTGSFTAGGVSYTAPGGLFYDDYLMKTDTFFIPQWVQAFGGTNSDFLYSVQSDGSDNVYVTGDMRSNIAIGGSTLTYSGPTSGSNAFLIKFDASGQFVYGESTVALATPGSSYISYERGKSICISPMGNHVYVLGEFAGTMQAGTSTVASTTVNRKDMFMMHYTQQPIILPLSVLALKGRIQEGIVNLSWQENAAIDPAEYQLQRSRDGGGFEAISTIKASGEEETVHHYRYQDVLSPQQGDVFYRLSFLDINGVRRCSNTVHLATQAFAATISVYPNPAIARQPVTITSNRPLAAVEIYDMAGRRIQNKECQASTTAIEILMERPGVYTATITDDRGARTSRVFTVE